MARRRYTLDDMIEYSNDRLTFFESGQTVRDVNRAKRERRKLEALMHLKELVAR